MSEYTIDLPPGYGVPTVDLATDRLPDPTMVAIAASAELSATFAAKHVEQPWYLDAYNAFFKGWSFKTGQGTAATTTTASSAAGATTLTVADGTGFINETVIVLGVGTPQQQINRVGGGGGTTTLTLTNPLDYAVASAAAVSPLWGDNGHLNGTGTAPGWKAWAYFIIEARRPDGTRVIDHSGKIVMFGNSWMTVGNQANYESQILPVYPSATVLMKGISGNTSSLMLARFDTDVPTDADYVVVPEPGINDLGSLALGAGIPYVSRDQQAQNVIDLVDKIRGIGAVPIFTGAPAFEDKPVPSRQMSRDYLAFFATPEAYPALTGAGQILATTPESRPYGSTGFGPRALEVSRATTNTAVGNQAMRANTTGGLNTAVGEYSNFGNTTGANNTAVGHGALLTNATSSDNTAVGRSALGSATGANNTAVGSEALTAVTTGANIVAVGRQAGALATGGGSNVFIGPGAAYTPRFLIANATTTGSNQTVVGAFAGQSTSTPRQEITAIGNGATVGADYGTSLGSNSSAAHTRGVALGYNSVTTSIDQIAIGGRHIELIENAPATPSNGAAGSARLLVRNNGSGKMQLAVIFPSGTWVPIVTEA